MLVRGRPGCGQNMWRPRFGVLGRPPLLLGWVLACRLLYSGFFLFLSRLLREHALDGVWLCCPFGRVAGIDDAEAMTRQDAAGDALAVVGSGVPFAVFAPDPCLSCEHRAV